MDVAIGQEGLPSGDYARAALAGLPPAEAQAILDNAGEEVTNNNGIIAAVDEGKAGAGFAYASDVTTANAAGLKLKAVELPPDLRQQVVYVAAVVEDAKNTPGAERFLETLLSEEGTKALERTDLGPPPG